MKILLSKLRALGDTVLFTATVEVIKKRYPQSEITVLVPEAFGDLFLCNPFVKNIWCYEEKNFLSWIWTIRQEKFDLFFSFQSTDRNRWMTKLSGAKQSFVQFHNLTEEAAIGRRPNALEWDPGFFNHTITKDAPIFPSRPKIFLSEQEKLWGRDFWLSRGADPKRVVFLGLGASKPTKVWPREYFARLAELLRDRMEFIPAVIFGPSEEEAQNAALLLDELRVKGFRPQTNKIDRGGVIFHSGLSVRELACALSACRAYVGNDSGPKHLSVAVGTQTFSFFGPEDPTEWHPYSREEHPLFFQAGLKCRKEDNGRWCALHTCMVERHRCMREIDPLDVFAEIQKKLGSGV